MNSTGYGVIGAVVKGSLLTLALFFLSRTIPLLGAFAAALIPFPCIYYSLKSAARVTGLCNRAPDGSFPGTSEPGQLASVSCFQCSDFTVAA